MHAVNPRAVQRLSGTVGDGLKCFFLGGRQHAGHPDRRDGLGKSLHVFLLRRIGHRPAAEAVVMNINDARDDPLIFKIKICRPRRRADPHDLTVFNLDDTVNDALLRDDPARAQYGPHAFSSIRISR